MAWYTIGISKDPTVAAIAYFESNTGVEIDNIHFYHVNYASGFDTMAFTSKVAGTLYDKSTNAAVLSWSSSEINIQKTLVYETWANPQKKEWYFVEQ